MRSPRLSIALAYVRYRGRRVRRSLDSIKLEKGAGRLLLGRAARHGGARKRGAEHAGSCIVYPKQRAGAAGDLHRTVAGTDEFGRWRIGSAASQLGPIGDALERHRSVERSGYTVCRSTPQHTTVASSLVIIG